METILEFFFLLQKNFFFPNFFDTEVLLGALVIAFVVMDIHMSSDTAVSVIAVVAFDAVALNVAVAVVVAPRLADYATVAVVVDSHMSKTLLLLFLLVAAGVEIAAAFDYVVLVVVALIVITLVVVVELRPTDSVVFIAVKSHVFLHLFFTVGCCISHSCCLRCCCCC